MLGLMVFGAIGLWAALTCLMLAYLLRRIWRGLREKPGTDWHRRTAVFGIFVLAWLLGFFWYGGGRNYYYDAEVKRLCAIDGGVKVYETVKLPPDKFSDLERNSYRAIYRDDMLGLDYQYKEEITYLRKGSPNIRRIHIQVFRKTDMKLLGEEIAYDRGGGNLLSIFGMASEFRCPRVVRFDALGLTGKIFTN